MDDVAYRDYMKLESSNWFFLAKKKLFSGFLGDSKFDRVLDVGCGVGTNMFLLKRYSSEVYGVDFAEQVVKFCEGRGLRNISCENVENLSYFEDDFFDLVLCSDILEHVNDFKALSECYRLLKKGGLLLFSVPAFKFLWHKNDVLGHHKRRYTKRSFMNLVKAFNFKVLKISYWNFFLFFPVLFVVYFQKVFPYNKKKLNLGFKPLNRIFLCILSLENWIIKKIDFPFGVELVGVLQKR